MKVSFHWATAGCVVAGLLGVCVTTSVSAQVNPRDIPIVTQPQQRFDAGQDIQPIFEGWTQNDDGSFDMLFGYLNRNYREQPSVPIGPNNYFSPGDPDRGQPTFFYPRTHRYQFSVRVPADMGTSFEDGLVWTVTLYGSEQKATAWLQPEWEIDENTITSNGGTGFGRAKAEVSANAPPTVAVEAAESTVGVGQPLTLTAMLEDDELPTELPPRPAERRFRIPALIPPDGAPATPDNIQWYRRPRPPRNGLSVLWVVYRGPAAATIDPPDYQRAVSEKESESGGTQAGRNPSTAPTNDQATSLEGDGWTSAKFVATVTFDEPGIYTLRAFTCDAMRISTADTTVTVTGASTGQ